MRGVAPGWEGGRWTGAIVPAKVVSCGAETPAAAGERRAISVGAWVAVTGLISSARDIPRQPILWVAFGIGLILTAWWTWKQAAVQGRRAPVTQAVISTGAFAVWVFALGGPFQQVPGREVYGSLLLILYTLVAALINPKEG